MDGMIILMRKGGISSFDRSPSSFTLSLAKKMIPSFTIPAAAADRYVNTFPL
jgi:hypothetical protein